MSRFYSRYVHWAMLGIFLAVALCLFSLAAGREALQLPGVLSLASLWAERPHPGEVRRAVNRMKTAEHNVEQWLLSTAGRMLEAEGRKLESKLDAPQDPDEMPVDAPVRLRSHRFSETAAEFKGVFTTDLPPGEGRSYFLRGPSRWVVDMQGQWRNASPRLNTLHGHFISRVVIDTHDSFLRIVFHCADPSAEAADKVRLEKGPTGFTVTILRPQ